MQLREWNTDVGVSVHRLESTPPGHSLNHPHWTGVHTSLLTPRSRAYCTIDSTASWVYTCCAHQPMRLLLPPQFGSSAPKAPRADRAGKAEETYLQMMHTRSTSIESACQDKAATVSRRRGTRLHGHHGSSSRSHLRERAMFVQSAERMFLKIGFTYGKEGASTRCQCSTFILL